MSEEATERDLKMRKSSQKFWFAATWIFGAITFSILLLVIGYVIIQGGKAVNWEF